MSTLFSNRRLYIGITLLVTFLILTTIVKLTRNPAPELVTTLVETGPVRQLVSVSGIAEATQTASLAFPTVGIVEKVFVNEGSVVEAGDTLAILNAQSIYAERQDALASLQSAIADRDELLAGPTETTKTVINESLASAQKNLSTTKDNEAQKIRNAHRTLLSNDLIAYSTDPNEDAAPPTITGTYQCDEEGSYKLEIFSSGTDSGYSYKLSGLETGTYPASTKQPSPIGSCGLQIEFDSTSVYARSIWHIDIPNTRSSSYTSNLNTYNLTLTQAENNIALAEQAVILAQADADNQNAPARSEAVARVEASITQARARVQKIDATIADRTLKAPFSGVITKVNIVPGETVNTAPVITLLAEKAFEITARIPEIDIGKLSNELPVEMIFDAKSNETVKGYISFISPQATEIDGVAYYEAIIHFDNETPPWMRSGLNADIDIILTETTNLRVPKRFVTKEGEKYTVTRRTSNLSEIIPVTILLEGNDGFYALSGVKENDILIAP